MIHRFNRKELILTFDLHELYRVKDRLVTNDIPFITRCHNTNRSGCSHGIPGMRHEFDFEYKIYVHKKDYEHAMHFLG